MRARLRDLVAAVDPGWTSAVVGGGAARTATASLLDGDRFPVRDDDGTSPVPADALLVLDARPDDDLAPALARVAAERGQVLVLLRGVPHDVAASTAPAALSAAGFEPVLVTATAYPDAPVAVVARRGAAPAEAAAATFAEGLAAALEDWRDPAVTTLHPREEVAERPGLVTTEQLVRERAATAEALARTTRDLGRAEAAIEQMESSAAMRVGSLLVGAAKNPRSAVRVPRQAYRMWRMRGGRKAARRAVVSEEGGVPQDELARVWVTEGGPERFAAHRGAAVGRHDRLVVLGALRDDAANALAAHAHVTVATPDDAVPLVARAVPDLVLVQTSVGSPGSPWAYLGDPAAGERERRLLALVDTAHAAGAPVVLWRDSPVFRTAALDDFARRCDLVVDSAPGRRGGAVWSPGVSLPAAVDLRGPRPRRGVLHAGGLDRRESLRRRELLVRALRSAGDDLVLRPRSDGPGLDGLPDDLRPRVGDPLDARGYAAACREAAVVLAAPFAVPEAVLGLRDEHLVALAAGARLVTGPSSDLTALADDLGPAVRVAREDDVDDVVRAALADGPLTPDEHRRVLRALAVQHSVPARLAALLGLLGSAAPVGDARDVAVLVGPGHDDLAPLVDALRRQRLRPVEVVLPAAGTDDRVRGALGTLGAVVRTAPVASAAAATADSPWLAPWSGRPWDDDHLLDLVVGAEAGRADAAALLPDDLGVRVTDALLGDRLLLRRDLVVLDGGVRPDAWDARERRLVAVGTGVQA